MPDSPEKAAGKGLDFLKQKVGPVPLYIWLGAGVAIWYVLQKRQEAATAASTSTSATGMVTDPAGNQCASGDLDNLTGYCTGTSEDLAALAQQQQASSGSSTTSAGTAGTSGAQTYADDNAWGIAAVNYLDGLGIDATTANQAIQQYLASQVLTSAQQGDVNLAIGALGPPPVLPAPTTSNPTPVVTPPGSGTSEVTTPGTKVTVPAVTGKTATAADTAIKAVGLKPASPGVAATAKIASQDPAGGTKVSAGSTVTLKAAAPAAAGGGGTAKKTTAPAPTGLVVSAKHSTSLSVKWNASRGATGYHVKCTDQATKKVTNEFDVPAAQATANCGGLTPSHSYVIDVWAEPEAGGVGTGAHAEVSVTLPKTG